MRITDRLRVEHGVFLRQLKTLERRNVDHTFEELGRPAPWKEKS